MGLPPIINTLDYIHIIVGSGVQFQFPDIAVTLSFCNKRLYAQLTAGVVDLSGHNKGIGYIRDHLSS